MSKKLFSTSTVSLLLLLASSISVQGGELAPALEPQLGISSLKTSCGLVLREKGGDYTKGVQAYIEDFRVNSENYPASFEQTKANLACSRWPMTAWVVWCDSRTYGVDIYLQRFDSLMNKAGGNIKVNDDNMQNFQNFPEVDCDSAGNAVVVWIENDRLPYAWGQRFDKNGNRLGANFKLKEDSVNFNNVTYLSVATIDGQGFVVGLCGYHPSFPNSILMGQRFLSNGSFGPHYYIDTTSSSKGNTSCGWGGNRVVHSWFDYRDGAWNVYARIFDLSGNPLGAAFQVSEPATVINDPWNVRPALAVGDTGQFCIAWVDRRNGNYDIYAQRYDCNGNPQGSNFKVNQDAGTNTQDLPQAVFIKEGHYKGLLIITFLNYSPGAQIYGSVYNTSGGLVSSSPFVPTDGYPGGYHEIKFIYRPSTVNYVGPIAWDVTSGGYRDVYAKDVYSTAQAIKCNSDSMGAQQNNPDVAADSLGRWLVVWQDSRRPDKGTLIMGKGFNADGTPATAEVLISDTLKNYDARNPCQAINPAGDYIIAWNSLNTSVTGVWGRIGGAPMSPNIKLSADSVNYKILPSAAIDYEGNFMLCWLDTRNSNWYDLYCRGFLAGALPVTASDVMVNLTGTSCIGYTPKVLSLGSMRFAFVYFMNDGGTFTIYGRLAEMTGTAINFLGDPFKISDNPSGTNVQYCAAASAPNGYFVIGWYDYGQYDLKARWFDRDGNPLGPSFSVSEAYTYPQNIDIAIDLSERTTFVWQQWVFGDHGDIYARLYNADRTPYTSAFRVNADPSSYYQGKPATSMAVNNVYFAWEDALYDTCGTDIFAKGYTWAELGVASNPVAGWGVQSLKLLPNAPNPFSKTTNIKFQIPKDGPVSLKVYNIAGQCVKTLINEVRKSGSYEVMWDGRDERGSQVSNGVYLYRLEAGGENQRGRMTVVR